DTGPIAMAERVPIGPDMTAGELHDVLARLGADLMVRALGGLERGALQTKPQPATGVTLAPKIENRETRIDWARPWKAVHDHCRGLSRFRAPGSSSSKPARRCGSRCCGRRAARAGARPGPC